MLFGRKKAPSKKRIAAFVDFEHWYYSMQNIHSAKPDIATWFDDLSKHGRVVDVIFFGDFTQPGLRDEIGKIRAYSNKIIETRNPNPKYEKDYTDFIMLDNIYQRALSSEGIDTFVIFSGDGHFSSAAAFLKNFYHREVGIYAVSGAVSKLLKSACDWCVEVPDSVARDNRYDTLLLDSMKKAEKKKSSYVTFTSTLEYVSKGRESEKDAIRAELQKLVDSGVIKQREIIVNGKDHIKVLRVDWNKASARHTEEN